MLHYVVADYDVDGLVLHRNLLYVEMHVGEWALQIGRDIVLRVGGIYLPELSHERNFGGDVQEFAVAFGNARLAFEPEPQQPVPFE